MAYITDPDIEEYARAHTSPEPGWLAQVASDTRGGPLAQRSGMLTGHLEGRFLNMLAGISGARRILEIGTFTGYSALSMAQALPPDGRIITCELSEQHAEIARRNIAASPFADRIELRIGPALDTIHALDGTFDMVFIDADKPGYRSYYDAVVPMLSERGFICIDNVLWSGAVLDASQSDASTAALRELNEYIASDPRVECVMVPLRDGITIVRRAS